MILEVRVVVESVDEPGRVELQIAGTTAEAAYLVASATAALWGDRVPTDVRELAARLLRTGRLVPWSADGRAASPN